MNTPTFLSHYRKTIESLYDLLENADNLDVDEDGSDLRIITPKQTILITPHTPTQQLWLSSTTSGAHHFTWDNQQWVNTRHRAQTLTQCLTQELDGLLDGVAL